jgi:hypothetical protein
MNSHEETIIRTFFKPEKKERYLTLLGSKKGRRKALDALNHMADLDPRYSTEISADADIIALLRQKDAPPTCYVISDIGEIDGREIPLAEAVKEIEAKGWGSLVGCVPGRLACYFGERGEARILLEKKSC